MIMIQPQLVPMMTLSNMLNLITVLLKELKEAMDQMVKLKVMLPLLRPKNKQPLTFRKHLLTKLLDET